MKQIKIIFLLTAFSIIACTPQSVQNHPVSAVSSQTTESKIEKIKYGPYERNVMDVYLPANRTPKTPFVINIHGGAWTMGDNGFDGGISKYLQSQGIAVANINYRYADDNGTHLPQLLDDVDNVVKYLSDHSKEWNTRNTGFSMTGGSSGAHVSLMYAYTRNPNIKAIVERCGPVDFSTAQTLEYIKKANLLGLLNKMSGNKTEWNSGDAVPKIYVETSPITHVKNIPVLILHGDKDEVVPVMQAIEFEKKLKEKNIPHQLVILPGAAHNVQAKPEDQQTVYEKTAQWLNQYGKN